MNACMWEFGCGAGAAAVPARVAEELAALPPAALPTMVCGTLSFGLFIWISAAQSSSGRLQHNCRMSGSRLQGIWTGACHSQKGCALLWFCSLLTRLLMLVLALGLYCAVLLGC